MKFYFLSILSLFSIFACAQCPVSVIHITGADKTAFATGSGSVGVPSMNYTAGTGNNRAVIFVATFERDHTLGTSCTPANRGNNFASAGLRSATAPTGNNVAISATWGGQPLTLVSHVSSFVGTNITSTNNTGTELSEETYTFIILESNIPAAGGAFVLGGDFQNPKNPGDEAVVTAATYANVGSYENITGANGTNGINSLSVSANTASASQPANTTGANNMIVTAMVFDKEGAVITASPGTIINDVSVSNHGGTYTVNRCSTGSNYTENDGIHVASLLTTGTGNQTITGAISGDSVVLSQIKPIRLVVTSNTFGTSGCAMPVTLATNFSAQKNGNGIALNWSTATETNCKDFTIQHSVDGKNWTATGTVNSKAINGNSNAILPYTFTDASPDNGENYYRLIQTDLDGTSVVLGTVSAYFSHAVNGLQVYPDPATNGTINVAGLTAGTNVAIYNINGQLVKRFIAASTAQQIDISALSKGVYFIKVLGSNITQHFIIK